MIRIILGWWFVLTNQNNKIANKRLNVCVYCPHRKGVTCGICGCHLSAKARVPEEECPKNLWI